MFYDLHKIETYNVDIVPAGQEVNQHCYHGNFLDKLQGKLRDEGGIKALLGMVRSRHADVLAQVARGVANFAKCESRAAAQGSYLVA